MSDGKIYLVSSFKYLDSFYSADGSSQRNVKIEESDGTK